MANIIEREIEKREALIADKAVKEAEIADLRARISVLEADIANTDTDTLQAEIDELKTYLPKPVEDVVEMATETAEPSEAAPAPDVVDTIVFGN